MLISLPFTLDWHCYIFFLQNKGTLLRFKFWMCQKRKPKHEDGNPKMLWSKAKSLWSKTKTQWSRTKSLWSKTKSLWSKMKTLWSNMRPCGLKRKPCGLRRRRCGLQQRPTGLKRRPCGRKQNATGLKPFCLQEKTIRAKFVPISVASKCHLSWARDKLDSYFVPFPSRYSTCQIAWRS